MENCFFPDFSGTHSWRRVCVYLFQGMNRSVEFHKIKYGWWFSSRCLNVSMVFMFMIPTLLKESGSIANQKWLNWPLFDHWDPWGRWLWLIYSTNSWCLTIIENPKSGNITYIIYNHILFVGFIFFRKSMSTGPLFDRAGTIARRQRGHGALRENGHTGGGPASTSREQRGSFHLRGGCFLGWWG